MPDNVLNMPSEFMDYPIITHDGNQYIKVDNHNDARLVLSLYNEQKTTLRASTIDCIPGYDGFYVRLDSAK